MAFSTNRQYSTSHTPTTSVKKMNNGAGSSARGGGVSTTQPTGNSSNELAALGGAGAVGAGLLGKYAYDKYKQGQMDTANEGNELYNAKEGTDFSKEGANADVMGGLATNSGGVIYEPGQEGLAAFNNGANTSGAIDAAKSATKSLLQNPNFQMGDVTGDPASLTGAVISKVNPSVSDALTNGSFSWPDSLRFWS